MNTLILTHVVTHDQGMYFRAGAWDVEVNDPPAHNLETVARIMQGLDDLNDRLDKVEAHPTFKAAATRGPAAPQGIAQAANVRALPLNEALAHAHAAHQAKQAEIWQERARKQLPPGTVPMHPNAAAEERQATGDVSMHDPQPMTIDFDGGAYARAQTKARATHNMIARPAHLTFADKSTLAKCAASTTDLRALRNYEALQMRSLVRDVAKHLGEL
jgi:hypothetical protein